MELLSRLSYWLSDIFGSGNSRRAGRYAHRVFEGGSGFQGVDSAPSANLRSHQWLEDEGHADLPARLVPLRTLSQPPDPHRCPPAGRPYGHPKRRESRNVRLVFQRGLPQEGPAPGAAAVGSLQEAGQETGTRGLGDGRPDGPLRSDAPEDRGVEQESGRSEADREGRNLLRYRQVGMG